MEFGVYTDIEVSTFKVVEAETAEEAIALAEKQTRDELKAKGLTCDSALGYCLSIDDVDNLTENEFIEKYGVPKHSRY